jgi:rhamnosyltransferase
MRDGAVARVLAVVVTFRPQADELLPLLQALSPQVEAVLVVDNTPGDDEGIESLLAPLRPMLPNLELRRTGENLGIAAAHNIGISAALAGGYDYILLSDQDSLPSAGMVGALVDCCDGLQARGVRVGCVCPEYFDGVTGQVFRFQVQCPDKFFYRSVAIDPAQPWIEIITTISSGTLIPRGALEAVGPMREDFFIDHVDTEWCHRARALGFRNFGTARARLTHHLGEASFRVWYFGWKKHSEYSPLRLYYRFRNFALLCRLPHVPLRWSIRAGWYWLGNAYAHCLFAQHRLANLRGIVSGLRDGLLGRTGPARMRT